MSLSAGRSRSGGSGVTDGAFPSASGSSESCSGADVLPLLRKRTTNNAASTRLPSTVRARTSIGSETVPQPRRNAARPLPVCRRILGSGNRRPGPRTSADALFAPPPGMPDQDASAPKAPKPSRSAVDGSGTALLSETFSVFFRHTLTILVVPACPESAPAI